MKTIRTVLAAFVLATLMYLAFPPRVPVLAQSHTFAALDVANTFTPEQTFSGGITGSFGLFTGAVTSSSFITGNGEPYKAYDASTVAQNIMEIGGSNDVYFFGHPTQQRFIWQADPTVNTAVMTPSLFALQSGVGLQVGGGTTVNEIIRTTANISFSTGSGTCGTNCILANQCVDDVFLVSGVTTSAVVSISPSDTGSNGAPEWTWNASPENAGSIRVHMCNPGTSNFMFENPWPINILIVQ